MLLDESIAKNLLKIPGTESINCYTRITDEAAEILSKHAESLYLDGLETVTSKTLRILLSDRLVVSLNGLEALPELEDSWDDPEVTILDLYLNGLKVTSSRSLKKVASVVFGLIFLNGLERLPQDDGQLFENCGAQIFLNGLKTLTDMDLEILGTNLSSHSLILEGLEELDSRQAELLVGFDRGTFSIGLRRMSDEVAAVLLRSQCEVFIMNRLEELTPFAAEICGRFIHAESVCFNGIQNISDEAFELLLADYSEQEENWCPGSFDLNGLKHLTPRMRKALEETKHEVNLNGIEDDTMAKT